MNCSKKLEIDREENICLSSLHQVGRKILLLFAFKTLFRHYWCVDSSYRCDKLVEVTDYNVAVRHVHIQSFEKTQKISR